MYNFLKHYHIGHNTFYALCDKGLPYQIGEKRNKFGYCRIYDTDEVEAWLKEQGIDLPIRRGRRSHVHRYITVDQAKRMFPHNPAMALLYAIFCTKDDYVKHFRNVKVDE